MCLEEERPASAEAAQHVVEPRAGRDQFGLGRTLQVGPTEAEAALEAAILIEHDPRRDQRRPWQMVGQQCRLPAVFGEVQHPSHPFWRRWRPSTWPNCGSRLAANPASVWPIAQTRIDRKSTR